MMNNLLWTAIYKYFEARERNDLFLMGEAIRTIEVFLSIQSLREYRPKGAAAV